MSILHNRQLIHGFVAVIGPENNPNYFTGCGYSCILNDAKVFRSVHGAVMAARYWQNADHNERPLGKAFWSTRRVESVKLEIAKIL